MHNEGKRCVVVLDVSVINVYGTYVSSHSNTFEQEIEKTEDEKALWSLLMPWELGEYQFRTMTQFFDSSTSRSLFT
jgi:hypothetical protein